MKNALLIAGANIALTLALIASTTPAGAVCFLPSTAKNYNVQGYAGYTFAIVGSANRLVIETKGIPGATICTPNGDVGNKTLNGT